MTTVLAGKVCLVTGATRGIGKGIALQLGEAGAIVYITGRTLKASGKDTTSLETTAAEITSRGGQCIPVQCDHGNMDDVEKLFERIKTEQHGQLDVLVNNAYSAVNRIMETQGQKFWEVSPDMWDDVNNVGLRNHYFCSVYGSRIMVPRKKGLIVNVSSGGGLRYLFNIPYGVGKEALDRMSVDCAIELRKQQVSCVSLWPGAVKTEVISTLMEEGIDGDKNSKRTADFTKIFENGESTEYAGKCVVHLAQDPNILKKSGRVLLSVELGNEYGFTDLNGQSPSNYRTVKFLVAMSGHTWISALIPSFLKVPFWIVAMAGNKF